MSDSETPSGEPLQPPAPAPSAELADPRVAAVLAAVLEQQSRDASANRAQARELIRAVEGLAKSHEFLGMELREERRRSRALLAALVVVPLAVVAAGLFLTAGTRATDERLESLRTSVAQDLAALRTQRDGERAEAIRQEFEARLTAAESDRAALRGDLDGTRAALTTERQEREARERLVGSRLTEAERDRAELSGLRTEVSSLRERAGAEQARADDLARLLADALRRPPAAPTEPAPVAPAPAAVAPPAAPAVPASLPPPVTDAKPRGAPPAVGPAPTTDASDLDRIRTRINSLLEGATGAARYEVEGVEGVSGTDLLGVRVVGRDDEGRTLRTVVARRAEITVGDAGGVRLRFADGHLLVGDRKAPFFDGTYTIALDSPAQPWRDSGLACVRFGN